MKKLSQIGLIVLLTIVSTLWIGCGDDMPGTSTVNDQFDRSAMLEHWTDGFIIPGYKSYLEAVDSMDAKSNMFMADPNISNLNDLRNSYRFAYNAWQEVSMFEIGKAEELALRNQTNIYPTNVSLITENVVSGSYNLELPSNNDVQGFPAIEYMIYGMSGTDEEIVNLYISSNNSKKYLTDLTSRISSLTRAVYTDWVSGYREIFIADSGSSASSSVNRMVNDYLLYFEAFLRNGKIGYPAGGFEGTALANNVEALYTLDPINKSLYLNSFIAFRQFFEGESKYTGIGPSLSSYLDYIRNITDGAEINEALVSAMDNVELVSAELDDDLKKQVIEDNNKMLATFDALQEVRILLKTNMLSALNIKVDYVDADGD